MRQTKVKKFICFLFFLKWVQALHLMNDRKLSSEQNKNKQNLWKPGIEY